MTRGRRLAPVHQRQFHVLERSGARKQVEPLEHEAHRAHQGLGANAPRREGRDGAEPARPLIRRA